MIYSKDEDLLTYLLIQQ